MTKKLKSFAICLLAAIAMVMGAFALNSANASGTFSMKNGASIRIRNTDNTYGIQFFANVDTSVEDATYNLMILPQTYVDFYEADTTENKAPLAEWMLAKKAAHPEMPLAIVENLKPDSNGVIKGSIVNVLYKNLNTKFVGAAYYEVAGEPVCADLATDDGRSIVEVAELAIADPENVDFVTDLSAIVKDGIHQANGKEQNTVDPITIAMDKTTANMYIGQELTLSYAPAIATSLATWSVEGDAVTVDNGKVTAAKAGTATVSVEVMGATASCVVTVANVQVINAENVSVTAESATKGSVTFTSPEDSYCTSVNSKTSLVVIKGDFDDEFIKVRFKTPSDLAKPSHVNASDWSNYLGNGLGVGGYVTENKIASYSTSYNALSFHLNAIPSAYGGGISINSNGANAYPYLYSSCIVNNSGYSIAANTEYSFVYGITKDATVGNKIYFALLNAEDELMWSGAYAQSKLTDNHKEDIAAAGSFFISSALAKQERTVTYEVISIADAMEIMADGTVTAPTVTAADNTFTVTKADYADGYMYKYGANDWAVSTSNVITIEDVVLANLQVKAYNSYFESAIASATIVNTEDDIELVNMSNVTSTELTHKKGNVSFNTPGVYRTGEGVISLKDNYTNELIKVGFTATSANIADAKLSIGLRESISAANAPNYGDEIRKNTFRFSNFDFGTAYTAFCCFETNYYSDHGGAKHETYVYKSSSFGGWKSLTAGAKYYMVAGMVTGNTQTYAYYALLDSNNTSLCVIRWDVTAISNETGVSIPTSGYFNIYSYKESDSITYEIIDADTFLATYVNDTVALGGNMYISNVLKASGSTADGVTTVTFKRGASIDDRGTLAVVASGIYDNTAYGSDSFVKTTFTAQTTKMSTEKINVGIRNTKVSNGGYVTGIQFLRFTGFGGLNNVAIGQYDKVDYFKTLEAGNASAFESLTVGNKYAIVAGLVDGETTDKDDDKYVCILLSIDDQGNETVLAAISVLYSQRATTNEYTGTGYFVVWSWMDVERTMTYEIISADEVNSNYLTANA